MRRSLPLTLLLASALALPALGATRLTYPIKGHTTAVAWPAAAFPISYQVDNKILQRMPGADAVIERAFTSWILPETQIAFRQGGTIDAPARRAKDGRNVVSLASTLYADDGFIALTTNWYSDNGDLYESDIELDPSVLQGSYNLPQTLGHEIGHLLGLDHSAVLTSVMYPWVGRDKEAFVLDSDDRIGISTIYPKHDFDPTLSTGTLQGRVVGDSGGVFAAQVVAINDLGQPVATGLTTATGDFELRGIPPGEYRIYAEPLDGPVDTNNLAGVWRSSKQAFFKTQFYDDRPLRVEEGRVYGNLVVTGNGKPELNPRWIAIAEPDASSFSLTTRAVMVKPGQRFSLAVAGDGFIPLTEFEVLNPGFKRVSDFKHAANYVSATFEVTPGTAGGSAVILVKSGSETATLTGALRVQSAPRKRSVSR
ncbi:MAG TPA: matrixin family metalloprotease [Thermoanaerobaculia bacterium]